MVLEQGQGFANLDVKIEKYKPSDEDIAGYIVAQRELLKTDPKTEFTLNQYLKKQYFNNQDVVVAADLSNRTFSNMDLSGGDFTGCVFKQTAFKKCNLASAVFCDVDFDEAYFEGSILKDVDFRGADLANCQFSDDYAAYSSWGRESEIAGIKFSTTSALGRQYANIKAESVIRSEQTALIAEKEKELNEAYKQLTYKQAGWLSAGYTTGNQEYDKLAQELKDMKAGNFPEPDRPMHRTFKNVFGSNSCTFDPAYVRGSTKAEREQAVQYVKLTREDVERYLDEIKTDKDLSLNDFARSKLDPSQVKAGARVVADCASQVDHLNKWHNRLDLSGLRFEGANLSGAIFAGSDLTGCEFYNTNISEASFEGAALNGSKFEGVMADNANFFNTDLEQGQISNSKFTHAFMSRSNGEEISVSNSNFDYANIKKGKWDHSQLTDSTFNHANLEGISLISASLRKVQMQHAILDKAVLKECEVIESDLSNALMNGVQAQKAKFKNVILENIEAKVINLSDAELDSLTKLDGADLQLAILRRINAEGVSFIRANISMVEAQEANLRNAILTDAEVRFSNLTGAILEHANAVGINASNSILKNVKAKQADFSNGIMRRIRGGGGDFTEVNFTEADLSNSRLTYAIMEKVKAEKARLVGADLTLANLQEADLNNATVSTETNMSQSHIAGVKGILKHGDEQISPQKFQQEEAIRRKKEQSSAYSIQVEGIYTFVDFVRTLPVARSAPEIITLVNNYNDWLKASNELWYNTSLRAEDRAAAMRAEVESMAVLIKNAGVVLDRHASSLQGVYSDRLKDTIVQYSVVPALNYLLQPMPYISLNQAVPGTFDMFNGVVNEKFLRDLAPIIADLAYGISDEKTNEAVQSIYHDLMIPTENSTGEFTKNIMSILDNPKISKSITTDLAVFLSNDANKEEITKMAEYVVESRYKDFRSDEFFVETVSLVTNNAVPMLLNVPSVVEIYKQYQIHQDLGEELLSYQELSEAQMLIVAQKLSKGEEIPESGIFLEGSHRAEALIGSRRKEIAAKQDQSILSILEAAHKVAINVVPIFGENLPGYLTKNKANILAVLDSEAGKSTLQAYGMDPKLTKEIAEATIPFIAEVLPILGDTTVNCLQDEDTRKELAEIINNAKTVMNAPQAERLKQVGAFVESLNNFQTRHPEVQDAIQKQIPDLLVKHAATLGPVIEKFLNETKVGKQLKLRGQTVLEALIPHSKELEIIVKVLTTNKGYAGMVKSIFSLLSDRKVLNLIAVSGLNLIDYAWQSRGVRDSTRRRAIGEQVSGIIPIADSIDSSKNLSSVFQKELEARQKQGPVNPILEYSLYNRDLHGLSFKDIEMKLDHYKIQDFNFNNVTFGKSSFDGASLMYCSFKGATFTEKVAFVDATIDVQTLETLLPAIKKYNDAHQKDPISLREAKIVGEVTPDLLKKLSEPDIWEVSFKGANLSLDNAEIQDFNFTNRTFGKCSLKGAVLENCSFKGAVFTKKVNFDGAGIDNSTLKTLIPVIEQYNLDHKKDPISLDNIKLTEEIDSSLKIHPLLHKVALPKLEAVHVSEGKEKKHLNKLSHAVDKASSLGK